MRAYMNLFIFVVHYGNVGEMLTHLFYPWKRTTVTSGAWYEKLIGTVFSMVLGFVMRMGVLLFTLLMLMFLVVFFPLFLVLWLLLLPFSFISRAFFSEQKKKERAKHRFIAAHATSEEEHEDVVDWFEEVWGLRKKEHDTYSLENLLSVPPIGNDWNYGFAPILTTYAHSISILDERSVVARVAPLREMIEKLSKSEEANVLLIGDPGVGKKTLLRYFATLVQSGKVPTVLQRFQVLELEMQKIWSEIHTFAQRYTFLDGLLQEAKAAGNCILIVNEFERYVTESLDGDFSGLWEKYEAMSSIKIIGVTTPRMVEKYMNHHEKVLSLFHRVTVAPMTKDEAKIMLLTVVPSREFLHRVIVPYKTVQYILTRSDTFMTVIPFPEKALVLLDESIGITRSANETIVTSAQVDDALSRLVKAPMGKLPGAIAGSLQELYPQLAMSIFGQSEALHEISRAIQKGFSKEPEKKPRVSLLFLGPTGVGKTETAKVVAGAITGDERNIIRFDMSFYQTQDAIVDFMKLFSEAVRKQPFGILLIDEIEKTERSVMNLFLTLLDEGYMIDREGQKVDCRNLVVIATSNAAQERLFEIFSPEFLNRFDSVVTFGEITPEVGLLIAKKLCEKKNIVYEEDKLQEEITKSFDPRFGARDVIRLIDRLPPS